jgi:hypothetical protein
MQRLLESFPIDPIAHPIRQVIDDARIVHVADGGVIQPAQRFGFAEKPGASGGLGMKVHPETDPPLQDLVLSLEEYLFGRGGNRPLQPVAGA